MGSSSISTPGPHNWLVQFDRSFPGGGIDGKKLWLDQSQFSEVLPVREIADAETRAPYDEEDLVDYRRNGEDEAVPF